MTIQEFKNKIYPYSQISYPRIEYWEEQNTLFTDFYQKKLNKYDYVLNDIADIDPIIRIIDSKGKRNYDDGTTYNNIIAVGHVTMGQETQRKIFHMLKNDNVYRNKLYEVLKSDLESDKINFIFLANQFDKMDGGNTRLIKKAACYLNAILFINNPRYNFRIVSLDDRYRFIKFLNFDDISFDSLTLGEKIVYTNEKLTEISEFLGLNNLNLSTVIYHKEIVDLWRETQISNNKIVSEEYEDLYENAIQADESTFEKILSELNEEGDIIHKYKLVKIRKLYKAVIVELKKMYPNECQICGGKIINSHNYTINEAHHIEYFSISKNNSAKNIMILCPNHHRLVHKSNAQFHRDKLIYKIDDGTEIKIILDKHLA